MSADVWKRRAHRDRLEADLLERFDAEVWGDRLASEEMVRRRMAALPELQGVAVEIAPLREKAGEDGGRVRVQVKKQSGP